MKKWLFILCVFGSGSLAHADDAQDQRFVNERIRPRAEAARSLKLFYDDDISSIGTVYADLSKQNPTWIDLRDDHPPTLLTPSDILAINAFMHNIHDAMVNDPAWPIILKACVRPVGG